MGSTRQLVLLQARHAKLFSNVIAGHPHRCHAFPRFFVVEYEWPEFFGVDCGGHVAEAHALDAGTDADVYCSRADLIDNGGYALQSRCSSVVYSL